MSSFNLGCLIKCRQRMALVMIGLVVGCAVKFGEASGMLFNLYQSTIKDIFHYTQTEVELLSSLLILGCVSGFAPGVFYDRFGSAWTSAVGLVVTAGAYLLIWSTSRSIGLYSTNIWLMAVYFYLAGLGTTFTYIASVTTNLINFDDRHSGKIVGILNAFYSFGGFICSIIFYRFFTETDDADDSSKYDFPGFMLFLAILSVITHIFCIFFLKVYEDEPINESSSSNNEMRGESVAGSLSGNERVTENFASTDNSGEGRSDGSNKYEVFPLVDRSTVTHYTDEDSLILTEELKPLPSKSPMSMKEVLLNVDFHLNSWPFALSIAAGFTYLTNITIISKSVFLDDYDVYLTCILHIVCATSAAFIGYLSDILKEKLNIPRTALLILGIICVALAQVLVLFSAEKLVLLELATVIHAFGYSIVFAISPLILNELFYSGNLGRNLGIMYVQLGFVLTGLQLAFGALYDAQTQLADSQTRVSGGAHCYGMDCIRGGTVLSILLLFSAFVISIISHVNMNIAARHLCKKC